MRTLAREFAYFTGLEDGPKPVLDTEMTNISSDPITSVTINSNMHDSLQSSQQNTASIAGAESVFGIPASENRFVYLFFVAMHYVTIFIGLCCVIMEVIIFISCVLSFI